MNRKYKNNETTHNRTTLQVLTKLLVLVKPLMGYMSIAILTGVLGFLCASCITIGGGYALLHVMGYYPAISLQMIFISIGMFAVLRGVLHYIEHACNHYIAFKLLALIRDKVFASLRKLAPAKLEGADKGNLIALVTSDIELLEIFFAHTISPIGIALIMVVIMSGLIGSYSVILGGIAVLAYLTVGVVIPVVASKKTKAIGEAQRAEFGEMNTYYLDSIRGMKEIKQFHYGEKRITEIENRTKQMEVTSSKMKSYMGITTGIINTCVLGFSATIFCVASMLYVNGAIAFDGVILPTLILFSSFGPVIALANLGTGLAQTIACGNRILDILEEEPMVAEVISGQEGPVEPIVFDRVDFTYDEQDGSQQDSANTEYILEQLSMHIEPGKITGIMGRSGSGKSTALKLIMRFWDVNAGTVLLGGQDIKDIRTGHLRQNQSFVTQETHLFHESIEANVKIGKLDASKEEVVEACKKASIHEFIMSLPNQYETQVGELGDTLSGGERQRIGLARAFLHNGKCMLLDEPTSNLDSLNEAVILKALQDDEERTIILVSHRKSTMTVADQVIEMSGKRVS